MYFKCLLLLHLENLLITKYNCLDLGQVSSVYYVVMFNLGKLQELNIHVSRVGKHFVVLEEDPHSLFLAAVLEISRKLLRHNF